MRDALEAAARATRTRCGARACAPRRWRGRAPTPRARDSSSGATDRQRRRGLALARGPARRGARRAGVVVAASRAPSLRSRAPPGRRALAARRGAADRGAPSLGLHVGVAAQADCLLVAVHQGARLLASDAAPAYPGRRPSRTSSPLCAAAARARATSAPQVSTRNNRRRRSARAVERLRSTSRGVARETTRRGPRRARRASARRRAGFCPAWPRAGSSSTSATKLSRTRRCSRTLRQFSPPSLMPRATGRRRTCLGSPARAAAGPSGSRRGRADGVVGARALPPRSSARSRSAVPGVLGTFLSAWAVLPDTRPNSLVVEHRHARQRRAPAAIARSPSRGAPPHDHGRLGIDRGPPPLARRLRGRADASFRSLCSCDARRGPLLRRRRHRRAFSSARRSARRSTRRHARGGAARRRRRRARRPLVGDARHLASRTSRARARRSSCTPPSMAGTARRTRPCRCKCAGARGGLARPHDEGQAAAVQGQPAHAARAPRAVKRTGASPRCSSARDAHETSRSPTPSSAVSSDRRQSRR